MRTDPKMVAQAPLRSAPEVVGEPGRGDRGDRESVAARRPDAGEDDDGAEERQPVPARVRLKRPGGEGEVDELQGPMRKAPEVPPGRAMAKR